MDWEIMVPVMVPYEPSAAMAQHHDDDTRHRTSDYVIILIGAWRAIIRGPFAL